MSELCGKCGGYSGNDDKEDPCICSGAEELVTRLESELATLKGVIEADDRRLNEAAARISTDNCNEWGCDAPDVMADKILGLRAELITANKLRHDQILSSDKALTKARKAMILAAEHACRNLSDDEQTFLDEQWELADIGDHPWPLTHHNLTRQ